MSRERSGRDRRADEDDLIPDGRLDEWHTFTGRIGATDAWPDGGRHRNNGNRPAEPTVLVESEGVELVRLASVSLLEEQFCPGDGLVVVSTRSDLDSLLDQAIGRVSGLSRDRMGVVGRTGDGVRAGASPEAVRAVEPESTPDVLTAAVRACFGGVAAAAPGYVHLLVDGVAASPGADVYDRMYDLAMGVGAEPGLALFGVDRPSLEPSVLEKLPHLFDVQLTLRDSRGEPEARWTALTGTSDGWQAVRELSFGVPAFV